MLAFFVLVPGLLGSAQVGYRHLRTLGLGLFQRGERNRDEVSAQAVVLVKPLLLGLIALRRDRDAVSRVGEVDEFELPSGSQ